MTKSDEEHSTSGDRIKSTNSDNGVNTDLGAPPPLCQPIGEQLKTRTRQLTAMTSKSSQRAFSRKNRVYFLRKWLLDTYPDLLLQSSAATRRATILDIAGGKGDLSWLLCNFDGVDSIVIDPRIASHRHLVRSVQYLRANPQECRARAIPDQSTYQALAEVVFNNKDSLSVDFVSPRHVSLLWDDSLAQAIARRLYDERKEGAESSSFTTKETWNAYLSDAQNRTQQALQNGIGGGMIKSQTNSHNPPESDTAESLWNLLTTKVDLLVGFHPDQATEAIMDIALQLNIPFCMVPCCVFPSEFPDRQLPDGRMVKKYPEFLEYLVEKAQVSGLNLHKAALPFPVDETKEKSPRNIVLYSLPKP